MSAVPFSRAPFSCVTRMLSRWPRLFHGFVNPSGLFGKSSGGPNTFLGIGVDRVQFSFSIDDSIVLVNCASPDIDRVGFNLLHMASYYMVRGVLDAISFANALSMTLIFDACTTSSGEKRPLLIQEPELKKLCTVPHVEIIKLAGPERAILKHLDQTPKYTLRSIASYLDMLWDGD